VMSFYYTLCKTDGIVYNVILHESNIKVFVMVILCRGQTTSCDKWKNVIFVSWLVHDLW